MSKRNRKIPLVTTAVTLTAGLLELGRIFAEAYLDMAKES